MSEDLEKRVEELEERLETVEEHLLSQADAEDPTKSGEVARSFRLRLDSDE